MFLDQELMILISYRYSSCYSWFLVGASAILRNDRWLEATAVQPDSKILRFRRDNMNKKSNKTT